MPASAVLLPALPANRFSGNYITVNFVFTIKKSKMIKTIKFFSMMMLLVATVFTTAHAQTNADTILGKWTNDDKTRVIEFVKSGSSYDAIIKEAPDKSIIGKNQLTGLVYKNGSYSGKVYLPKKGKSFPCTVKLNSNGSLELSAKAGFMSKSQTWTRVK